MNPLHPDDGETYLFKADRKEWRRLSAMPRAIAGAPSPCPVFESEILVLGGDDGLRDVSDDAARGRQGAAGRVAPRHLGGGRANAARPCPARRPARGGTDDAAAARAEPDFLLQFRLKAFRAAQTASVADAPEMVKAKDDHQHADKTDASTARGLKDEAAAH